ncbi:MAG: DUF4198 domain-containing protein [Cyclobacteriaceae bacterium]|nr:DUF4198 domain-containing protein [Cyclobacteriaceae bacterium]
MKRVLSGALLVLVLSSHDMFLKMDGYFLRPNTENTIKLFNGTYETSENVIARNRMLDVSLVGNGKRIVVDSTQWYERDNITHLRFQSGSEGTWVAGVSTKPRNIALAAKDFNHYLEHDGVLDMLTWRTENNALEDDAVERYSKHVKTIFQVGDALSMDWKTVLDYPLEFVPLENPYDIHPGHALPVQLLFGGKPLANQLVYVGHEVTASEHSGHGHSHADGTDHSHEHGTTEEADHQHADIEQLRTDDHGIIRIAIAAKGIWYLRTIYLVHSQEEGLTHESNWATLTFAVGDGHVHEHSHGESGIPSYVYWIASLLLVIGLFFWFNRKK